MRRWAEIEVGDEIKRLLNAMEEYQRPVSAHRMYSELNSLGKIRTFMETHVFAVWDFMSLLSAIRNKLTCTTLPWLPTGEAETRRFVNELFLAEDSDLHPNGERYTSHFELYIEAMRSAGAETTPIECFISAIATGVSPPEALSASGAPEPARSFVDCTWRMITKGSIGQLLGAFTFGRENVIPSMFSSIRRLAVEADELSLFVAYLDRHIELDGDEHAPAALRMVSSACTKNFAAWGEVLNGSREALAARSRMWDAVYEQILRVD